MWMNTSHGYSGRTASSTRTRVPGSADSRLASAAPADPPPIMMKSYPGMWTWASFCLKAWSPVEIVSRRLAAGARAAANGHAVGRAAGGVMADSGPAGGAPGEFSPFPPIADYGFLSDCEVTALVAPGGSVEWMCLPRMDSPSVFGAMLDRDAGIFRFGPEDMTVPADRRYLPGTMVLETSWDCGEGWIIVRDCLVMGPWRHEHPERSSHVRPPTDYDAEHILLRT